MARSPDYQRDEISLYLGDCMEVLPQIGSFNTVVTSPPYNQKLDQIKPSGFKAEGNAIWADRIASSYFDSLPEDQYQREQVDLLNLLFDRSAGNASLFYNHKCRWRDKVLLHPLDIFRQSRWSLRQEIIWSRDGSLTQNAKMFPPSEERILWGFKGSWKWNPESNKWMSVWKINSVHNSAHPVAFPLEIPSRCIEATTDNGDTVLDPYCGSGTTGVACIQACRAFIGIERDPRYFEIAVNRINQALDNDRDSLWSAKDLAKETQHPLFE